MELNNVFIEDTYAESWQLEVVRLVITAMSLDIALGAAYQFTGAAGSSELGSRINGGIERNALTQETPDGRPGVIVSMTMPPNKREEFIEELALRYHLATLIPTVSIYDFMISHLENAEKIILDDYLEQNWQDFHSIANENGRELCVVPTTTGFFNYERKITLSTTGVDGHIVCYAQDQASAVAAVKAAKYSLEGIDGASPMGYGLEQIYKLHQYCPGLKTSVEYSKVPPGAKSILNLLYFGVSEQIVAAAMKTCIEAAVKVPGVIQIGAMNFGGEFGPYKFYLRDLFK